MSRITSLIGSIYEPNNEPYSAHKQVLSVFLPQSLIEMPENTVIGRANRMFLIYPWSLKHS